MIGWTPRYLVSPDLAMAMTEGPNDYTAKVVRVNPHASACQGSAF